MSTQQLSEELVSYRKEVQINATREKVYQAITTHEGIAGWWTGKVHGMHIEGGTVRFEFDGTGHVMEMRVEKLRNPELVTWTCLAHNFFPEWATTKLNFTLTSVSETSCKLSFEHLGLEPVCECYDRCSRGWDHFLASLVSYCETGVGAPWK